MLEVGANTVARPVSDGGRIAKDIGPALFSETLGHCPTVVVRVTAVAEDGNHVGMIIGTCSSVSRDPPLIALYPMNKSRSFAQVRTATASCVNVLTSD